MNVRKPPSCGRRLKINQTDSKISEKMDTRSFFISLNTTVTSNEDQVNSNLYKNVELSSVDHHTKFDIDLNRSVDV